jgi:hypothetical protein
MVGKTREERIWEITGCKTEWTLYRVAGVPLLGLAATATALRVITEDTLRRFAWGITV